MTLERIKKKLRGFFLGHYTSVIPRIDGFGAILKRRKAIAPTWYAPVGIDKSIQGLMGRVPYSSVFAFGGPISGLIDKQGLCNPALTEKSLARLIRKVMGVKYRPEPSLPGHLMDTTTYYSKRIGRLNRFTYMHVINERITPMKPKYTYDATSKPLHDGYGVCTPADMPTAMAWLQGNGHLPNVKTDAVFFAKSGKYLNHQGVRIGKIKIAHSTTLFKGDGVSYLSMSALKSMVPLMETIKDTTMHDSKLKSMCNLLDRVICAAHVGKTTVVKGWVAGSYVFGKGMLHILTDREFRRQHPDVSLDAMVVDDNFVKLMDINDASKMADLYIHDVVSFGYKNKVTWTLVERLGSTLESVKLLTDVLHEHADNVENTIQIYGLDRVINGIPKDEQPLDRIMDANVRKGSIDTLHKTLHKKLSYVRANGFSGYLIPMLPGDSNFTNYDILLNPYHKGKVDAYGLLTRWPLQGPFGGAWVRVGFSSKVPIDAMMSSSKLMSIIESNMAGDTDGDRLVLFNKSQDTPALTKLLNSLCVVPVNAPNTKKATTVKSAPAGMDRAAVLARTAVSQALVAPSDLNITSVIVQHMLNGSSTSVIADSLYEEVSIQQGALDGIKHLSKELPSFMVDKPYPVVSTLRAKDGNITQENLIAFEGASTPAKAYAHRMISMIIKYSEVDKTILTPCDIGMGLTTSIMKRIKEVRSLALQYSKVEGRVLNAAIYGKSLILRDRFLKTRLDAWMENNDTTPHKLVEMLTQADRPIAEAISKIYDCPDAMQYQLQLKYWKGGVSY